MDVRQPVVALRNAVQIKKEYLRNCQKSKEGTKKVPSFTLILYHKMRKKSSLVISKTMFYIICRLLFNRNVINLRSKQNKSIQNTLSLGWACLRYIRFLLHELFARIK